MVFLNGYQGSCAATAGDLNSFRSTFARADEVLQREGRASLFFDNCSLPGKPPIETLGRAFGDFLAGVRNQSGQPVPEFDVVAHSMGGLIVRSYLAGKSADGTFAPPVLTRIRKLVFLGTPHFGSPLASLAGGDAQARQLEPGSPFQFDLATWNQGLDDLRGVDAIAVAGNAGSDAFGNVPRFHDSTVTLTSASLDFITPARTRIVNFCHTSGVAELLCRSQEGFLAQLTDSTHQTARIISSFFNSTPDWQSVGGSPQSDRLLSTGSGLTLQWRDANDRPITISRAEAGQSRLTIRSGQVAYIDYLTGPSHTLVLTNEAGATTSTAVTLRPGGTNVLVVKPGPAIAAVVPAPTALWPRSLAPGMFVSIYGRELAATEAQAATSAFPLTLGGVEVKLGNQSLPLHYVGPTQINAVMPGDASGYTRLTVRSANGESSVGVWIEPVVPALFNVAVNAITGEQIGPASPARAGDYLTLYLTGLGRTETRDGLEWAVAAPTVMVGEKLCEVTYAGRAPGYLGLDQVNCRLPADVPTGAAVPLTVRSGARTSNVYSLAVQ